MSLWPSAESVAPNFHFAKGLNIVTLPKIRCLPYILAVNNIRYSRFVQFGAPDSAL